MRATFCAAFLFSTFSHAAAPCAASHCGAVQADLNKECILLGMQGKPFPVIGPTGSVCTCTCSCVIEGTLIDTPFGEVAIEKLAAGMLVSHVYRGRAAEIVRVLRSEAQAPVTVYRVVFEDQSELVVSENHTFVTANGTVARTIDLPVGALILDRNHNSVAVKQIIAERYTGALFNLVIRDHSELARDHVVITNGKQSGDFLMQATRDASQTSLDFHNGTITLLPFRS